MKQRQAALAFILIALTIDMVSFGIIAPVLPKLVRDFLGGSTADAARMFAIFGAVFAIMQFLCSPIFGILSDRLGRRPILIASMLGLGLDYIVMALAPGVGWLFIGRVVSGITTANIPTAYAYITDITTKEKRAGAMGLIGAAFGFGFIVGPALGGLLGQFGPRVPFWVAAGLTLVNAAYGFFVLPESLARQNRATGFAWRRANPLGSLRMLRSHPELSRLSFINFIEYIAHEILPVVFVLYAQNRYHWSSAAVGGSLAVVGVSIMVVQAGLIQPVVARIGERNALILGLCFGTIAFVLFGIASTGAFMLVVIPLMALWGFAGPAAQSLMTHRVSVSEQGELQGALGSMRGITMIAGPLLFGFFYAHSLQAWNLPGGAWFLAALLLAITVVLALGVADMRQEDTALERAIA
jgi:DHA1 family tetracycline resistance protein-like MFS transporter